MATLSFSPSAARKATKPARVDVNAICDVNSCSVPGQSDVITKSAACSAYNISEQVYGSLVKMETAEFCHQLQIGWET